MTPPTDEMDMRDTARALSWLYQLLDQKKHEAPPPKDSRIMAPTQGPRDPLPVWILDAEDRLLEERKEEDQYGHPLPKDQIVPGGLRNMVVDAAEHVGEPVRHPDDKERLAGQPIHAWEMLDFVARRAQQICLDFPPAYDLLELMQEQARWLAPKLNPDEKPSDEFLSMKSIQKMLNNKGVECPAGTIRRWASEGHVATSVRTDWRRTYSANDVLSQLEKRSTA